MKRKRAQEQKDSSQDSMAGPPRIESLKVRNFRSLCAVELKNITPLTVLLGANGSGKSTVFDVFNFLSECFRLGLRQAWDNRGRAKELKTRGQEGPVMVEIRYRERHDQPLITYHLEIDESSKGPFVAAEWLQWTRSTQGGRPFRFLNYKKGIGEAISGDMPDFKDTRVKIPLRAPDVLAVSTLGQFAEHPRIGSLRDFIADWYVSYLSIDDTRKQPSMGPQERLNKTGDNIANVLQFLKEQHPSSLEKIFAALRERIPRLESVNTEPMPDGRLLLQIKDGPFQVPIIARFVSDGTLKMLAYLLVFHEPKIAQFIGIEEPENFLHPRLLPELAEECRMAAGRSQLLITTHSPFFVNSLEPEEVRVLYRDGNGHTQSIHAPDMKGVVEFKESGALLGDLWWQGHFEAGDPLANAGAPHKVKS